MIIWLGVFVAIIVLGVLGTANGYSLTALTDLDALARIELLAQLDRTLASAGILTLLALAGFWVLLRRLTLPRWLSISGQAMIILSVLTLFGLRSLIVMQYYEARTPDQRIFVTAQANISEISDGVYDPVLGSSLRQVAVLSDVRPYSQSQTRSLIVDNPLFEAKPNASPELLTAQTHQSSLDHTSVDLSHLNGISVLMTAHPAFIKPADRTDYQILHDIKPAQSIEVDLLITPIQATPTASGFNSAQWLTNRYVHAQARIMGVGMVTTLADDQQNLWSDLQRLRQLFRDVFYAGIVGRSWHSLSYDEQQAQAVTLSLLTGDRALIDRQTKDLYQFAGISHLLAISGTHVLFLALLVAGLMSFIVDSVAPSVYQILPRWQMRMMLMVVVSLIYALFTGFDVPAMRTVYMLIALWCVRAWALPIGPVASLVLVGLVMVWFDPLVLWQAAFWLSFITVLLIIRYEGDESSAAVSAFQDYDHGIKATTTSRLSTWIDRFRVQFYRSAKLQLWLFLTMLPLSILLFNKISILGLLFNLFAISLFGIIIVPLNLLAGVLYALTPTLSGLIWQLSTMILQVLHGSLQFLLSLMADYAWLYAPFGMAGFILSFMIVALLLLGHALPRQVLIVPILTLIFMIQPAKDAQLAVQKINSASNNLSYTLVSQYADNTHWLMMANHKSTKLNHRELETLADNLRRQGVNHLNGVVVQTADDGLHLLVQGLAQRISIHEYWQAGEIMQGTALRHQRCVAGQTWSGSAMQIRALTGWHGVDDAAAADCALEIISKYGTHLGQRHADEGDTSDDMTADEMDSHVGFYPDKSSAEPASYDLPTQLILNANQSGLGWAIWSLLCESDTYLRLQDDPSFRRYWLNIGQATLPHEFSADMHAQVLVHHELPDLRRLPKP